MIDKAYQLRLNTNYIKRIMEEKEMKYADLCERMGCDKKTLRHNVFDSNAPTIKLSFINSLAIALDVSDPISLLERKEIS